MKFKKFVSWFVDREAKGVIPSRTSLMCTLIIADVKSKPFWRREKYWKYNYEAIMLLTAVHPIDAKLGERF